VAALSKEQQAQGIDLKSLASSTGTEIAGLKSADASIRQQLSVTSRAAQDAGSKASQINTHLSASY